MIETTADELEQIFPGASDMARRMRQFDWSSTDLGPPETWPQNLRTILGICLSSRFPMHVWWGPNLTLFYNDACIPFLGAVKHPHVLGRSGREAWAEIWHQIEPMIDRVLEHGEASWSEDILMYVDRDLPREEVFLTFSFSPIFGENGDVEGLFCVCTETTEKVVGNQRIETLRRLGVETTVARNVFAACEEVIAVLRDSPQDFPFTALYLVAEEKQSARLAGVSDVVGEEAPEEISLTDSNELVAGRWPLTLAYQTQQPQESRGDCKAVVLPICRPTHEKPIALWVAGVSPHRPLDTGYRTFLNLVAGQIATAMTEARPGEEERQQGEASWLVRERTGELTLANQTLRDREDALQSTNLELHRRLAEYEEATRDVHESRRAALNVLEDMIEAQQRTEKEVAERKAAQAALRESELTLERELADTQQLRKISQLFIEQENPQALYEEIVDAAAALMHSDAASLQMLDPTRRKLQLLAWRGFHPEAAASWQQISFETGTTCGIALEGGQRMIVPDVFNSEFQLGSETLQYFQLSGIVAVQSTPLVSRAGQIVGMISTHWRTRHQPSERDLARFDVLVRQAADVIERSRAEQALRESEAKFRRLSESGVVGVAFFDTDGPITQANDAFLNMLGATRAEVEAGEVGWDRYTPQEWMPRTKEALDELFEHGQIKPYEKQFLRKDGTRRWGLFGGALLNSRKQGVAVVIDITDRKEAEEALADRERELEIVVNRTPFLLTRCSRDLRYQFVSRAYAAMVGSTSEEIAGKPIVDVIGEAGFETIRPHIEKVLSGHPVEFESEVDFKKGGSRCLRVVYNPDVDDQGNVTGWIASILDVTEQKQQQAQVERQARLIELSFEPILIWDFNEGIIEWNAGAEYLYGFTREEALGRKTHELLKTERAIPLQEFRRILEKEGMWMGELRHTAKSGRQIIAQSRHQLVEINGRRLVFETIWDITERKMAEEALSEALWQQQALYEFVQTRNESDSLSQVYEAALDVILKTVRCDRASILLFDRRGVMRFVASRGISAKYQKAVEGHSPWKPDARDPQPIWIDNLEKADLEEDLRRTITREGIKACGFIPLRSDRGLIGKFMVYYNQPHHFDESDVTVSGTIAGQLTLAIERLRAQESLRRSEERFRLLVEGAKDYAIFLLDLNDVITYWSKGAERLFGWTRQEAEGKKGAIIFTPEDRAKGAVELETSVALRDGRALDRRWHQRKDGSRFWTDGVMMRIDEESGEVRGLAKIARDATDQREYEEALREARDELEQRVVERTEELSTTNARLQREIKERSRLEQEVLLITEREKRKIGQELHDSLCQELAASAFILKSQAEKIGRQQPRIAQSLEEAAQVVNANVGLARDLARGLHPIELSTSGLLIALRDLAYRTTQASRVKCQFTCPRQVRISDDAVVLNLYRIAQEAVNNAIKHADPRNVTISLRRTRSAVVLQVTDDGKGIGGKTSRKGMGLQIMQHRANVIGGSLTVESQKGRGTTVTCTLPGE